MGVINNAGIKFFAVLFPVLMLFTLVAPLLWSVGWDINCLQGVWIPLSFLFVFLARSTGKHEKNIEFDEETLVTYMTSRGFREMESAGFRIQMVGRYRTDPDKLVVGGRVMPMAEDGFRPEVSDRYYFYIVDGSQYEVILDDLTEQLRAFRKI